MNAIALQLGGSLIAILLLALIARQLGLGGDVRIRDAEEARRLAGEALYGFEAVNVGLDRAGIGALLRDGSGRVMLLRRHGAHFAARLLERHDNIRLDRNFLVIGTGERTFGTVTLDLREEAQAWAGALRRLGS
jgi:hypothetical protein